MLPGSHICEGVGRSLMEFAEDLANKHKCVGTWLVSGMGRKDESHRFYNEKEFTLFHLITYLKRFTFWVIYIWNEITFYF